MGLMEIAYVPPVVVDISTSVLEAIRAMVDNNVGAVAVVTEGKIRGIFSERDVMKKATASKLGWFLQIHLTFNAEDPLGH